MRRKMILGLMGIALLTGCNGEPPKVLQSPCAGLAGSPCGPKRDVNGWWRHDDASAVSDHS